MRESTLALALLDCTFIAGAAKEKKLNTMGVLSL